MDLSSFQPLLAALPSATDKAAEDGPSMIAILGFMLAGLGLFFTGLNLISVHLKQMTGRRLQEVFSKFAGRPVLTGWCGFILGGVTQSDAAVAFLSMNLLRNRLVNLRQAMILMAWSSVGTSLLVFFTTFSLDTIVTYLLGTAGIMYAIEGNWRLRPLAGLVFGLGLIFFGLILIEDHAGQMQQFAWFTNLLTDARGLYFAGFCVGAFLTLLTQSSSAVSVVAIVLVGKGILQPSETLMIIYGTNFGSAIGLYALAFKERGVAKRLAMFEVVFNIVAAAVLVPLFYLELGLNPGMADVTGDMVEAHTAGPEFGVPLVFGAMVKFGLPLKQQMAVAYLLFNLVAALIVIPMFGWLTKILEKHYPEDAAEAAGRTQYLHPRATRDPVSCLDLIVDEQDRVLQRLGDYFCDLPEAPKRAAVVGKVFESGEQLGKEIDPYLHDLIETPLPRGESSRLARLVERQGLIESLNREYFRVIPFVIEAAQAGDEFAGRLREGFEATTLLVTEALCGRQAGEIEMASLVTRDGGDAIRRLQQAFTDAAVQGRSAAEQARMLQATTGLERLVWLLHAATRNAHALAGVKDAP
jgi:phosphate:Na+ symporter